MQATSLQTLAIIRNRPMRKVLLGLKGKAEIGTGKYNAPGGKWEESENILQCVAREVREEVRLIIRTGDLRHIGVLECYSGAELRKVHVYYTESFSGRPIKTVSMKPEWVLEDDLPLDKMHEADRYWFPLAVKGKCFRCRVWYERPGEGYIDHEMIEY